MFSEVYISNHTYIIQIYSEPTFPPSSKPPTKSNIFLEQNHVGIITVGPWEVKICNDDHTEIHADALIVTHPCLNITHPYASVYKCQIYSIIVGNLGITSGLCPVSQIID